MHSINLKHDLQVAKIAAMAVSLLSLATACGGGPSSMADSMPVPAEAKQVVTNLPNSAPATEMKASENEGLDNEAMPESHVVDAKVVASASDVGCEADAVLFKQTMVELINAARVDATMCGDLQLPSVNTVKWNDQLSAAAVAHAKDMVTHNFFNHTGSDGLGVSERVDTAGYQWRAVGENIAAGQLDMDEVHQSWLDSEGHCKNIMNDLFSEVGAACMEDPNTFFGSYWVVVFGDAKKNP